MCDLLRPPACSSSLLRPRQLALLDQLVHRRLAFLGRHPEQHPRRPVRQPDVRAEQLPLDLRIAVPLDDLVDDLGEGGVPTNRLVGDAVLLREVRARLAQVVILTTWFATSSAPAVLLLDGVVLNPSKVAHRLPHQVPPLPLDL